MQRFHWDFWTTKPHTENLRSSQATPASSNLLHQYFQPLQFLTAHHLPLIYSWCAFDTWPAACFTIKSQTSSNLKFGEHFHNTQSWSSTPWQPSCLCPSCPPQQHWYFRMPYKRLAILEPGRTILSPGMSEKILCIFSVPNQACCAPDRVFYERAKHDQHFTNGQK